MAGMGAIGFGGLESVPIYYVLSGNQGWWRTGALDSRLRGNDGWGEMVSKK